MATVILCEHAKFTDESQTSLTCKVTEEMCSYQMFCRIVDHATNTNSAVDCRKFIKKQKY